MGRDKSRMIYLEHSPFEQRIRLWNLFNSLQMRSFVSCQAHQGATLPMEIPRIIDPPASEQDRSPALALTGAHAQFPEISWLVLACDIPGLVEEDIVYLCSQRSGPATAYSTDQGLEPLIAIWEPIALGKLQLEVKNGNHSLKDVLENLGATQVTPLNSARLKNINSMKDA